MTPLEVRRLLHHGGYIPIPCRGKIPVVPRWQKRTETNDQELELWSRMFPDATNTGVLCATVPCVDIDILNPEAAEAAEALIRERYEERGYILVRIGLAPKRAVLFRTDEPFKKIQVILIEPN